MPHTLKSFLDGLVAQYEQPTFIADDPVSLPHAFDDPRDQEIIALYAALLAWGRRATILSKMGDLCERMAYRPYAFVYDFDDRAASRLAGFKHRTFQPEDAIALTRALSAVLRTFGSLEDLLLDHLAPDAPHIGDGIEGLSRTLLSIVPETPARLRKHLARPSTGSACKRLCLYARWMVRPGPVDLGIWTRIAPRQLLLPLDVHSGTQARRFGLLDRRQNDWRAVQDLTATCRLLDPDDPCRYDFAFFGAGVSGENPTPP